VMHCSVYLIKRESAICTYQITEQVKVTDAYIKKKKVSFTVYYNESCEVNCSCCLFELIGILCKYVISVLIRLDVISLLEKYFLNR
jgi:hypothetical protein